jgi:hypothetical protein
MLSTPGTCLKPLCVFSRRFRSIKSRSQTVWNEEAKWCPKKMGGRGMKMKSPSTVEFSTSALNHLAPKADLVESRRNLLILSGSMVVATVTIGLAAFTIRDSNAIMRGIEFAVAIPVQFVFSVIGVSAGVLSRRRYGRHGLTTAALWANLLLLLATVVPAVLLSVFWIANGRHILGR